MSDHLLDSGILIRHLRDQQGYPELVNRLTDEGEVFISAYTRLEIVRGMRTHERQKTYELLDMLETIPVTAGAADLAGEFVQTWRKRGLALGDADALIAASALVNGLTLVTTNIRHYPMPELAVLQADEEGHLSQAREDR